MKRPTAILAGALCALAVGWPAAAPADDAESVTVVYGARTTTTDAAEIDDDGHLWLTASALPEVAGLELKPEGICTDRICIPVKRGAKGVVRGKGKKARVDLTALAEQLGQVSVAEPGERVFGFAEVPQVRASVFDDAIAPDFALEDQSGKTVRLSDFRGKKVFIVTWASW